MTIGSSAIAHELERMAPFANQAPIIQTQERLTRLEKARRLTRDIGADALLIGAGSSLDYFAGLPGEASERLKALLLPVKGEPVLVCPFFEHGSFAAELKIAAGFRLWQEDESPYALIGRTMRDWGLKKLAVDPGMPFAMTNRLGKETGLEIVEASPVIDGCRMCKSAAEIAIIQQAMTMTLTVQQAVARILHEGMTTEDVVAFIEAAHRKLGSPGNSFCIVQFGHGTAFPHGLPGVQRLKENDLVLVDTGCFVQGYTSDLTRTCCFGKPTDEQRRIWEIEKEAEAAAFACVEVGVPCEDVDAAARAVLMRHGLGPDYQLPGLPHRTGHGIGLSLHEPPYIVRGNKTKLAAGMCFSDEPMIVVPDRFGIRLEDHIHVIESGAAWFTPPQPGILTV